MSANDVRRAVDRARWIFDLGLVLDLASWSLAGWMAAAGVLVVVVKVAGLFTWIEAWHVLVTGVPFLAGAAIAAIPRRYDRAAAAAWLDLKGMCGGAVIAGAGEAPRVRPGLRLLPLAGRLALPASLLAASLVVPWMPRYGREASAAAIVQKARVVDARIEQASRMGLIDEAEALALRESLGQARAGADSSPEASAEAVDEVQRELSSRILEEAEKRREALDAARDLMEKVGKGSPDEVGQALEKALGDLPDRTDLPAGLREAIDGLEAQGGEPGSAASKLDPGALEQMGKMIEQFRQGEMEGLGNASDLMADAEGRGMLAALAGEGTGSEGEGRGGQGGIDRGPGDAPLVFGDESDPSGARFEPLTLEPGKKGFVPASLQGTKTTAGGTAPEEFQPGPRAEAEVTGEGGSMAGAGLGPFNEGVVVRYFAGEGGTK